MMIVYKPEDHKSNWKFGSYCTDILLLVEYNKTFGTENYSVPIVCLLTLFIYGIKCIGCSIPLQLWQVQLKKKFKTMQYKQHKF